MKRMGILLVAALVLSAPVMAVAETVGDYIKLAHQKEGDYLDSGDPRSLEQAIVIYNAIIRQLPTQLPEVYAYRGDDYASLGYSKEAIRDFTKALALDTPPPKGPYLNHEKIYQERGEAESDIGEYRRAVADFTQALAADATDLKLLDDRAKARVDIGDCGGAISDYSSAIEETAKLPGDSNGDSLDYRFRASARVCTGDLSSALEDLRVAIRMNDVSDTQAHVKRIHSENLIKWALLRYLGRKVDADRELSAELAEVGIPKSGDSDYDAARYFLGETEEDALFNDAASSKKQQPEYAASFESDAWYYVALKQLGDGHDAAAIKTFQKVLSYRQVTYGNRESAITWVKELERKRR